MANGISVTPGVSDFAYVSLGTATTVVADGGITGDDVGIGYEVSALYISTQSDDHILAEDNNELILE